MKIIILPALIILTDNLPPALRNIGEDFHPNPRRTKWRYFPRVIEADPGTETLQATGDMLAWLKSKTKDGTDLSGPLGFVLADNYERGSGTSNLEDYAQGGAGEQMTQFPNDGKHLAIGENTNMTSVGVTYDVIFGDGVKNWKEWTAGVEGTDFGPTDIGGGKLEDNPSWPSSHGGETKMRKRLLLNAHSVTEPALAIMRRRLTWDSEA